MKRILLFHLLNPLVETKQEKEGRDAFQSMPIYPPM